ncbi:J domain-containing protein [Spiroplasma endosymbiont of Panzeria rudis]|uniref:J domain-containing protein n=1 Tax=Spiroplasma endosymbiont of Panzeria rudis TaxID=3066301 RepID=UPI0030D52D9A
MKTYYEILEIAVNATHNDIRNAYKKKSRECHPDKHSPDEVKLWTERFKEVDSAYKTLIDEELRKKMINKFIKIFIIPVKPQQIENLMLKILLIKLLINLII